MSDWKKSLGWGPFFFSYSGKIVTFYYDAESSVIPVSTSISMIDVRGIVVVVVVVCDYSRATKETELDMVTTILCFVFGLIALAHSAFRNLNIRNFKTQRNASEHDRGCDFSTMLESSLALSNT